MGPGGRAALVGFAAVVVAVIILAVSLRSSASAQPPGSFRFDNVSVYDLESTCSGLMTQKGWNVSFHWWAAANISFGVWSCSVIGGMVYWGNGTEGSGSFVSVGGEYEFGAICPAWEFSGCVTADVAGNYTSPVVPR
jgi:hypothetical protein